MQKRPLVSLLAGLALIIGLTTGCANTGNTAAALGRPCVEVRKDLKQAKANQTEQAGTPAEAKAAQAVKRLETELKSCNDGSSTTTSSTATPPPSDGTAGVADSDGELRSLPLVDDNDTIISGDSTGDPRTPASYELAKENGPLVTWADAERELGKLDWYVEAVEARKSKTGFDWEDVSKWATATDIDPRVIHVFNMDVTDQGARDAVRDLVGSDADRMPIARHMTCIVNTRGFGHETVQDFADCRKMVRVSLAPIVYDEKGEPVGLRSDAGIFVDCLNIWWIPRQVVPNGPPPSVAPPATTTPTGTIPPGTVPPTTRPGTTTSTTTPRTTTTVKPKDPTRDPCATGNSRPGGCGPEEGPSEGPTEHPAVIPPPVYVPPTPPTVPPTTRPPVTAPPTTTPPATTPPTTTPPTTVIPPPR